VRTADLTNEVLNGTANQRLPLAHTGSELGRSLMPDVGDGLTNRCDGKRPLAGCACPGATHQTMSAERGEIRSNRTPM
jgi:hypothetical protein